MPGAYYPNREPLCLLECGCITGMEFAVWALGSKRKKGKRVWSQLCPESGEWQTVEKTPAVFADGRQCRFSTRLF